jgi:hypothetical protein
MKKSLLVLALIVSLSFAGITAEIGTDDGRPHGPSSVTSGSLGTRAPGSLTTMFASNNGYRGNTFDIIPSIDMNITGMDVNVDALGVTSLVDVYYLVGTSVGNEGNQAAWTLIGQYSGMGMGVDNPTFLDMTGNGINFVSGQSYGIYVDVVNYGAGDGINYTNGGPNTYSNADLSLITNTGQSDPPFGTYFNSREWNGTVYYETSGVAYPILDVKVNGSDSFVVVPDTDNVKIDIDIQARAGAGYAVDIWVTVGSPFGYLSYDGTGPYTGWNLGLTNVYFTGALADVTDTVRDGPVPAGMYSAHIGIDTKADGKLDYNLMFDSDSCPFESKTFVGFTEDFDDGVADGWIDDGAHWQVTGGVYYLDCPSYADWFSYYDVFNYGDFTYTCDMRQLVTTTYSDTYDRGVYFRTDGTQSNGYEVYMQNDGNIYFYLHSGSSGGSSQFSQLSPNIVQGAGNWNTISVDARGSNFDIFINGVLDFTWTDTLFTSGKVGLMGQGSGFNDQDYEYDNIRLTL